MRNMLLVICFLSALVPSVSFAQEPVLYASSCHSSAATGYYNCRVDNLELNTGNILMGFSYGTSLVSVLFSAASLGAASTGNSDIAWGGFAFSLASEALSIGSYAYNSDMDRVVTTIPVVVSSVTILLNLIAASVAHNVRSVGHVLSAHNVRINSGGVSFSF